MRKEQLSVLEGGNEGPTCDLCALGLYLGQGRDVEVKRATREYMATLPGRITLCTSHREDVEALGVTTGPVLQDAEKPALSRKNRRAIQALQRRAHRRSLPGGKPGDGGRATRLPGSGDTGYPFDPEDNGGGGITL